MYHSYTATRALKETHKAQIVRDFEKEGRQDQRMKMLWQQFPAFRDILSICSRAAEFEVKMTLPQKGLQTVQPIPVDQAARESHFLSACGLS